MKSLALTDLARGDYVTTWVYVGGGRPGWERSNIVLLRVVRVNRVTVTVKDAQGHVRRIGPEVLTGTLPADQAWKTIPLD